MIVLGKETVLDLPNGAQMDDQVTADQGEGEGQG